jgi:long-chain acyl-CoA synthetase
MTLETSTAARQNLATTIATLVRDRAHTHPTGVALRHKHLGIWQEVSWAQYWDAVLTTAHALVSLGLDRGDTVSIQSENCPEWLYLDVATIAARGVTVGIYPTNPVAELQHVLADCGAKIHLAQDQEQMDKVLGLLDESAGPDRIIYIDPRGIQGRYADDRLLHWDDFQAIGAAHRAAHPEAVENLMTESTADDVITLVYTSGTTGPPKGAMLTVDNIDFATATLANGMISPRPTERDLTLSYLPLCHVAERFNTVWQNAYFGLQVNFAESIDTVAQDLREVQPTILFGVPRIWEKLLASVHIRAESASPLKRAWAGFWLAQADSIGIALATRGGRHTTGTRIRYAIGWVLIYRALRERLGLRRARFAASGAAPIAPEVLRFFMGIGVPIHEVYGMTENTAVATVNRPGRIRLGTVGEPHDGTEVRLEELTGEILTRHRAVFRGYWNDEPGTAAAIDGDGWLHTGDVGEWVEGTHLKITDRLKDIIITAGGKNVSPSEIENALKVSPYVKESVVIGDRRRYLTALIGIELETVGNWAQRRGVVFTTHRDLVEKPEVISLVGEIVRAVNERFSSVEQIKDFRLLPKELDHEDGELTATQKVKRSVVEEAFAELVDGMYQEVEGQ